MIIAGVVLLVVGSAILLLAGLGNLRMPDCLTRMHAATKGATLGVGAMLLGSALFFGEIGTWTKTVVTAVFVFLTAPVAAHLVSRAAVNLKVPLFPGTLPDSEKERASPKALRPSGKT